MPLVAVPSPANAAFAGVGFRVAVDAEQNGTEDVELAQEEVSEGDAVEAVFVLRKDLAGAEADVVDFAAGAAFVDELGEDELGEGVH